MWIKDIIKKEYWHLTEKEKLKKFKENLLKLKAKGKV